MGIEHPHLDPLKCPGGLFDVEPCEMDLKIGLRGKLINPDTVKQGTLSLEPFTVIGVQKDYRGQKCWRVVHDTEYAGFGRVMSADENIEWSAVTPEQLARFRQTGRDCADLGAELRDESLMGHGGRIYCDALFIEDTATWANADGKWYTLIGRCEYLNDNLLVIESILCEFAASEGYLS